MSELNDVSVAIGRLAADSEAGQRQRADLFQKVDDLHNTTSEIKEILATMPALVDRVNDHEKAIGGLQKFKNRALIGVAGIGGGGGFMGANAGKIADFVRIKFGGYGAICCLNQLWSGWPRLSSLHAHRRKRALIFTIHPK